MTTQELAKKLERLLSDEFGYDHVQAIEDENDCIGLELDSEFWFIKVIEG